MTDTPLSAVERVKEESRGLRGDLAAQLAADFLQGFLHRLAVFSLREVHERLVGKLPALKFHFGGHHVGRASCQDGERLILLCRAALGQGAGRFEGGEHRC